MILPIAASLLLAAAPTPPPELPKEGVYSLSDDAFVEQAKRDLAALHRYANGLRRVQDDLDKQQGLFHQKATQAYSPEQKQVLLSAWAALFDYTMSTELIRQRYWDFVKLPPTNPENSKKHALGFLLTHGALTTELAHGLKFSDRTAGDKQLETLLDEPSPEFGIPPRAFEQFKYKVIHVATTTQLITGDSYASSLVPMYRKTKVIDLDDVKWVIGEMKLNSKAAKDRLIKRGVTLFAKNAADLAKDGAMQGIFPIQKNVAEWMGDTRVARIGKPLIKKEQVEKILQKMQPGDIMVERQNWFISNIGLPGFWPHAELYLGSPTDFAAYFDADPDVQAYVKTVDSKQSTLSGLIQSKYPEKWKLYSGKDPEGDPIRVMEAISEGVSLTGIEHAMVTDYIGVMRPRVSKVEKAKAMLRAFNYQGRPYDFDFDFFSDSTLVCSELVWKSYAPTSDMKGINIPLVNIAGRMSLPPNDIVRKFDEEADKPDRQLDFVAFLDGREKTQDAVESDEATFRKTYRRQKWDILQK